MHLEHNDLEIYCFIKNVHCRKHNKSQAKKGMYHIGNLAGVFQLKSMRT